MNWQINSNQYHDKHFTTIDIWSIIHLAANAALENSPAPGGTVTWTFDYQVIKYACVQHWQEWLRRQGCITVGGKGLVQIGNEMN